jgi:hypothetical protein
MTVRRDYLKDCHNQVSVQVKESLPLEDFSTAYCARCLQPECTRSAHGSSKFDQRVATWEDRLFLKVPRMDSSDPRFESISSKEFHPVQESLVVHGWGATESDSAPKVEVIPEKSQEEVEPAGQSEPACYFQPISTPSSISRDTLLLNTSVQSEQYLPGAPKNSGSLNNPKKKIDSWGASEQSMPSEVIVNAGATVRFGSGVSK